MMKRSVKRISKSSSTLAVLAVVAALTVGLALAGWSPAAVPTGTPAAQLDPGPPQVPTESNYSVLFVGDSYTVGAFANYDSSYACLTAANLGWQCNVRAQPGTGYISGGDGHRLARELGSRDEDSTSVPERFPRLRELDRADVVVLDAGRNDLPFGAEAVRNMMLYSIQRAIETWPHARIVVMAPWMLPAPDPLIPGTDITFGRYLEDGIREHPEFNDVTFIDPGALGWFNGVDITPYVMPDGVHPNVAGDKLISQLLTSELIRRGFAAK